jgi:hypothetical protein
VAANLRLTLYGHWDQRKYILQYKFLKLLIDTQITVHQPVCRRTKHIYLFNKLSLKHYRSFLHARKSATPKIFPFKANPQHCLPLLANYGCICGCLLCPAGWTGRGLSVYINPFQPSDAMWHHTFHLSLIVIPVVILAHCTDFSTHGCIR